MLVVGIDPGLKGGIAFITPKHLCQAYPLPVKHNTNLGGSSIDSAKLARFIKTVDPTHVFIEQVMAFQKNNRHSISISGQNWGRIVGILELLGIPYSCVEPKVWQRQLFVSKGPEDIKDRIYSRAQLLFPDFNFVPKGKTVFHDGMVDALMIAKYGLNVLSKLT